MTPVRYHPLHVALHWLLAVLLIGALAGGMLHLQHIPNDSPEKIGALRGHMIMGVVILALTLVRLVVHHVTRRPAPASTGKPLLDRLGRGVHFLLYALVVLMAASGFAMAFQAGLPDIVFGGSGAPLPASFAAFPPRAVHGLIAWLLLALIAVHVLAATYHQVILRDGLLSRMGFGRR
jgi:cytochrome b561